MKRIKSVSFVLVLFAAMLMSFTGSVLASVARAAHRLHESGQTGARTMFDIPPALLSPLSPEELRAHLM